VGMSKKTLIRGVFVALAMVVALQSGIVFAQRGFEQTYEYRLDGDLPQPTGVQKSLTKLGRGISNILFGWAEIPVFFDKSLKEGKSLQYLVGVVPVVGGAKAVMRTATGVFETVSFPFSDREVNYESVLEPEYLF